MNEGFMVIDENFIPSNKYERWAKSVYDDLRKKGMVPRKTFIPQMKRKAKIRKKYSQGVSEQGFEVEIKGKPYKVKKK